MKTELPVRSAVLKHGTGGLVVRWVTTSEYLLLYVFCLFGLLGLPNFENAKLHVGPKFLVIGLQGSTGVGSTPNFLSY